MLRAMLVAKQEQLLSRDHEIEQLVVVIAKLRRHPLRRQARGVPPETEQLQLKLEELETRRGQRSRPLRRRCQGHGTHRRALGYPL
jgi:hypothetical protein